MQLSTHAVTSLMVSYILIKGLRVKTKQNKQTRNKTKHRTQETTKAIYIPTETKHLFGDNLTTNANHIISELFIIS